MIIIYPDLETAKEAIKRFKIELEALYDKFDVSIASSYDLDFYFTVSYRDNSGNVKSYEAY